MSSTPTPNHIRIYRDHDGKHATLDGHELLIEGISIEGVDNPNELTMVHLTLIGPKVTIESELQ